VWSRLNDAQASLAAQGMPDCSGRARGLKPHLYACLFVLSQCNWMSWLWGRLIPVPLFGLGRFLSQSLWQERRSRLCDFVLLI
jgi:hypothetical protein